MKKGVVIKRKYDNMDNIVYVIKTENNEKIESIAYSKFDNLLKKQEKVNFEIIDGKAKILDNRITRVKKMTKKDYSILFAIIITIVVLMILYLLNIINKTALSIIMILFLFFVFYIQLL